MQETGQPTLLAKRPPWGQLALPYIIMAVVLILDQLTKRWIEANIPLYSSWAPFPALANVFQLTHTANTGMAFGMIQGSGWVISILTLGVVAVITYFNFTMPADPLLRVALGLVMGGAIGNNLIDRFRLGHVTDFVDIGPWYIFNVADMAITSGVILLGYVILFHHSDGEKEPAEAEPALSPAASDERNGSTD